MTQEEVTNLVQGIYDGIFDSITRAEPGGKPVMPAASTVLSLMKPGMAIRSRDFANPWTPGNIHGSQDAALHTAQLADIAPKMSSLWTDSGNTISNIYGGIMNGVQIPAQPPNPAIEAQLANAENVLYRQIDVTDPETGQVTKKRVESQLYRDYLDNQQAYFSQRAAYIGAYTQAQATAAGKATWPLVAPTMQIPVKAAYDKWRSGGADQVEQAIAIKNTSSQNALSKAFDNAKKVFEGYGVQLDETGSGLSPMIHRCSLLPSDWHSVNSSSKWTTIDSASGSFYRSSKSEFTSGGGSVGFSLGIFSIGGGGGHSVQHKKVSTQTNNLRFSYEYTYVTFRRPWLMFNLLGTQGWNLQNLYPKGKISNGSKSNQDNSLMPLLPTGMVVARNIRISAQWDSSEYDYIKKQTQAGGGFGIGPFRIGGSYAHSSTNETFSSAFAGDSIVTPGVQIIGWVSQVVPFCPPA